MAFSFPFGLKIECLLDHLHALAIKYSAFVCLEAYQDLAFHLNRNRVQGIYDYDQKDKLKELDDHDMNRKYN